MMSLVPALVFAAMVISQAATTPGFRLSATLRDGTTISGSIPKDTIEFLAVSSSGEIVKVNIQKALEQMDHKVLCEIDWVPDRHVFVVRQAAWTGELVRLWDGLDVLGQDGTQATIRGEDVRKILFLYADSNDKNPALRR